MHKPSLPVESEKRNRFPMFDGLLAYFPNALAAVAELSLVGNEQHNPGEPLHHARNKSTDHANKIVKHLIDSGLFDSDGVRHSAKVAWRALALLQEELERAEGYPVPRGAKLATNVAVSESGPDRFRGGVILPAVPMSADHPLYHVTLEHAP